MRIIRCTIAATWLIAAPVVARAQASEAARAEIARGQALLASASPSRNERLRALWAFRRATELAPRDPATWYAYAIGGMRFGNADGELAARDGFRRLMDIDPLYRDAWHQWLILYRGNGERRDMRVRLGRHPATPLLRGRIAGLLIEEGRYVEADSVLALALAEDSANGSLLALGAQSAFERGQTQRGEADFERALAHADNDPDGILWAQALGVASAREIQAWRTGVLPSRRPAWFRAFWWRRSSDLWGGTGGRVAEHFQRLRIARQRFTLTQPLFDYHRDAAGRGLHSAPSTGERVFYDRCEARWFPGGPTSLLDEARAPDGAPRMDPWWPDVPGHLRGDDSPSVISFGATADMSQLDSGVAMPGIGPETGLDDRGLLLLRQGVPRTRTVGSPNTEDRFCVLPSLEHWEYDGLGTIRFFRPEDVVVQFRQGDSRNAGSVVMRPMNDRQFEAGRDGLATDRTSSPAPLRFTAWFASFPTADPLRNLVYAIASRDTVAFVLTGDSVIGPASGTRGIVSTEAGVGRYFILVHARAMGELGRMSSALDVRPLGARVAVSDPLLAARWNVAPRSREDVLAHVSRTLRFHPRDIMRVYTEVLRRDGPAVSAGRVSYELIKTQLRPGDPRLERTTAALRIAYDRQWDSSSSTVAEWVDITLAPELSAGSYLLRLRLHDMSGAELGRSYAYVDVVP